MRRTVQAGSPFGIPILISPAWFAVVVAAVIVLGGAIYPFVLGSHSPLTIWLIALATAAIFFGGMLLHEFGHALAARRADLAVRGIALRSIGGRTLTAGRFRRLSQVVLCIGAGPAVTVLLGLALLLPALFLEGRTPLRVLLAWSGLMQLAVGAVNLLPIAALDGGRLLRAARLIASPVRRQAAMTLVWAIWLLTLALAVLGCAVANGL